MFFLLSKTVALFLKPIVWIVAASAIAFRSKIEARRRRWAKIAALTSLFFSSPIFISLALKSYEKPPVSVASLQKTWKIGVLLGGYADFKSQTAPDLFALSASGSRLTETIELFRTGRVQKLILSGGSGKLVGSAEPSEAFAARDFLIEIGLPDTALIAEPESRTTAENAYFVKKWLEKNGFEGEQVLLITSAWHMPRAEACFRKKGVRFDSFPVDHQADLFSTKSLGMLVPDAEALSKWEFLIKEWVGLAGYRLKGAV